MERIFLPEDFGYKMDKDIFLTAVGDIAFEGRNADRPLPEVFNAVSSLFKSSALVIANLENPLIETGQAVPGKCVLRGSPEWAKIIREAGINIVSLANNHMMDFGVEGLVSTIQALDDAGIGHLGAGMNIEEACAPFFVGSKFGRIAFLARTAVEVSSPSNASPSQPGVAYLDEDETFHAIRTCHEEADFVVLLVHWGVEHYHYPSPEQRDLAQRLVGAGTDIILGHHPHVLQGVEMLGASLVAYSLGNFLFDQFAWSAEFDSEKLDFFCSLSDANRESTVLQVEWHDEEKISWKTVHTEITSEATVAFGDETVRQVEFARLSQKLACHFYRFFWRLYALGMEWQLRVKQHLSLRRLVGKLHRIRPRHVIELVKTLRQSAKVASGKSTNPYE